VIVLPAHSLNFFLLIQLCITIPVLKPLKLLPRPNHILPGTGEVIFSFQSFIEIQLLCLKIKGAKEV